jgi:5-methylcytosine-specific restriction endonuclease McrA
MASNYCEQRLAVNQTGSTRALSSRSCDSPEAHDLRGAGPLAPRCQACGLPTYRLEVHHIQKRSQGGSDFDLDRLVALCPPCHAQTDAPYARGRLVITALGQGRLICEVMHGADKWASRA